jgi:hypothetical protein
MARGMSTGVGARVAALVRKQQSCAGIRARLLLLLLAQGTA